MLRPGIYNFEKLEYGIALTIDNYMNQKYTKGLDVIKEELEQFFGIRVDNIFVTMNTDKAFFGLTVFPDIKEDDVEDILKGSDRRISVEDYKVEFDSKLFELGLSIKEISAVLLYEVSNVIKDSSIAEEIKNAITVYLSQFNYYFKINNDAKGINLVEFAIRRSYQQLHSLFNSTKLELLPNELIVACGYGDEISSAYKAIRERTSILDRGCTGKLVLLEWALKYLVSPKNCISSILLTLEDISKTDPSAIIRRKAEKIRAKIIKKVDVESPDYYGYYNEGFFVDKYNKFMDSLDYSDIRDLKNQFYEYSIRVRNVDVQDEALILSREINSRISILDALARKKNLSSENAKECNELLSKYYFLRSELSKKKLYGEKYYGLFVQTPVIKNCRMM